MAIISQFPLHVVPGFSVGYPKGHFATWLPQIAEGFSGANGIEFHWIALDAELPERRAAEWMGQKFHGLPTAKRGRAASFFREDRRAIHGVLREIEPDFVHGWGNEDACGLAAVTSRYPAIVGVQGLLSEYVLHNAMPARVYLQAMIELFVLNRARELICESRWSCERTRARCLGRESIHQVDYGVQKIFHGQPWQPDPRKPIALFAGSVDPRKGIQDVVAAFRDSRLAGAELHVVGSDQGKFAGRLKAASPANIFWHGRRPIEECAEFLGRAWCLVLPTRSDTGPMALKEARVVGLPVICSPHSGARDYLVEGGNGFLVDPGDIPTLADRLAKLLGDHALCRTMGAMRHAEDRRSYHPDTTVQGLLEVYRGFARSRAKSAG